MFKNRQPKYSVNLVFRNGTTRIMIMTKQQVPAGEIMFEFPDMILCPANSFFINRPVPLLTIDQHLISGQTYLVLPHNSFSSGHLSMSSIAALASTPNKVINFNEKSFQYVKGSNGRALIKVSPEFLTGVLLSGRKVEEDDQLVGLCSTPELKKHYQQLVGTRKQRNHVWSPKLETISEYNNNNNNHFRICSGRFLEWKKQRQLLMKIRKFKAILHLLSRIDLRNKELHRIQLSPRLNHT